MIHITVPPISHELQLAMDIVNPIIFIILFSTLVFGILQFRWDRQAEKERDRQIAAREAASNRATFARDLYRDYLRTSLEHPELSSAQYDKDDKISLDKYDTFVSFMLYAFDEMINQGQDEIKYWKPTIEGQVEVHREYLEELFGENAEGDYGSGYSSNLMNIIRGKLKDLSKSVS